MLRPFSSGDGDDQKNPGCESELHRLISAVELSENSAEKSIQLEAPHLQIGAANKTFKYVLPHVSEALKTGEEVYSAMNASVLASCRDGKPWRLRHGDPSVFPRPTKAMVSDGLIDR